MTQQEKRPVHCETCYSLSYSVTAPLPAGHSWGTAPSGPNLKDHLTAPQAQVQQKAVGHNQDEHSTNPVCAVTNLWHGAETCQFTNVLWSLHDEG